MPKVIDETKLNYNKYPGEHVIASGEVVQIGSRTFHIVQNHREAFDAEKLEQRFSDVLDKYDYIVGDWGFEQLRLKGFFSASRRKMLADNKIDHLEDYINEYCNYGCAYFVLRRIRSRDAKKEEAFVSEKIYTEKEMKQTLDKPRRKRNRNRNRNKGRSEEEQVGSKNNQRTDKAVSASEVFQIREKVKSKKSKTASGNAHKSVQQNQTKDKKFKVSQRETPQTPPKAKTKDTSKPGFVIRTRGKD